MMTSRKVKGFTLAEVCVAVGLMGLICSLVWPVVRQFSLRQSENAHAQSNFVAAQVAKERDVIRGSSDATR